MHYFADLIVTVSPEIQEEFKGYGLENVVVWQKSVDTDTFSPDHYNEQMRRRMTNNRTDNPFVLVQCGRFAVEKRIHLLKEMMDKLPSNVHLCLVGSGPEETKLRKLFLEGENNSTANRVTFTGYMSGIELSQAFASADAFVMTSDCETMGCVVLESLASGVPCIGVNSLGVSGLIDDGVTGYLCDNDNIVNEMVDRINRLQNDTTLCKQMGVNGRKETLRWSIAAASTKLREVQYIQCINNYENRFDAKCRKVIRNLQHDVRTATNIVFQSPGTGDDCKNGEKINTSSKF
jgi:sulfoquinovosyltransferase